MLLLSATCKFYGKTTCMQIHTLLKMPKMKETKRGETLQMALIFKLSSMCIQITWKYLLLYLNEQYYLFQVIE